MAPFRIWFAREQRFINESEAVEGYTYTYLQYANQNDVDGNPIYNGDIVRCDKGVGTVEQDDNVFLLHVLGHEKLHLDRQKNVRVIGNRYTHMPDGTLLQ
jgi:hypothetical protein